MTYALSLEREYITLPDGRTKLNLWVGQYEGFLDDGVFLMQDRTGLPSPDHKYMSLCNAVNLVEYPYGTPEGPRGMFRSGMASLVYPSRREAELCVATLMHRIETLIKGMTKIYDTANRITTSMDVNGYTLDVTVTKNLAGVAYLKMKLNAPVLLIRKGRGIGTVCLGVCTPVEMNTIGTSAGSDQGWRVNEAEFITYGTQVPEVLQATMDGLEHLDQH